MPVTEDSIKAQLPPDARKSVGETKEIAGVIDDSLGGDMGVLANQARLIARARGNGTIPYPQGSVIDDDLVKKYLVRTPQGYINRSLTEETIMALQQGWLNRDQQYVGANTDWTGYFLSPLAKFLQPFDTPTRGLLPRFSTVGIDAENWRAITSVFNGSGPDVTSFVLPQQTAPKKAQYVWATFSNVLRSLSWSDVITEEAEIYGRMFEPDVRAKVAAKLAPSLMTGQETWYLNSAQKMWSPPPSNGGSTAASGGALSNNTLWVAVTAYNFNGETLPYAIAPYSASVPFALPIVASAGGSSQTISFNLMRIPNTLSGGPGGSSTSLGGGWAYRVYIGTGSTQPANTAMWLQTASLWVNNSYPAQLTTHVLDDPGGFQQGYMNVTLTGSLATSGTALSTVAANAATVSENTSVPTSTALTFDGLQSLAYLYAGTLSSVGEGGGTSYVRQVADKGGALAKSDLDGWLESMYFNARANPECMLVGIKDHKAVSNIVMNASNFRVNTSPNQAGLDGLIGGGRATGWVNQTTGRLMDIIMCPYLTQGTMIALSLVLPFSVAEIEGPPLSVRYNKDMWAREYPPDQSNMTQWKYASFSSETIRNEFMGGTSLLTGIVTA